MSNPTTAPHQLLSLIWKDLPPTAHFLDLGCGAGHDSLFMAQNGFEVTAVDNSTPVIEALDSQAKIIGAEKNLQTVCADVIDFNIEQDRFDVILLSNVLQFLTTEERGRLIKNVKSKVKINGYVLVSGFTEDNPSFKRKNETIKSHLKSQELLNMFRESKVIYYYEGMIL
ncbi:MAG: class I SAM-dependent methyltransferase, partial [Parcubacteria group bacterium]